MEAAKEVVTVISQQEQERADTEVWNTLYEDAVELAAKFEVQPSKSCNARKQRHREHFPADNPCQYWKRAMYRHTDEDVCIDSHGRALFQNNARRLKNYLRSTTTERMSGLALMHVHKDTELDAERIIHQFSHHKNRRISLLFSPGEGGCSN